MTAAPAAARTRRARPLHLLWIVPLGLAITYLSMLWMVLAWCGVSGCSGGGFGRISSPSLPAVVVGAVVVLLGWVAVLSVPRWLPSPRTRLLVGLVVGLLGASLAMLIATNGFIR